MANTKGLGKGLSALLGDDVIAAKDERASSLLLPISQVESCSTQPRKSFEPEALSDLADSIRIHGSKQQQAAAETVAKDALSVRQTELLVKKLTAEKKEKPQKDALSVNYVEEAARELGEKLGRPCRIVNGKKKGRIELEYYGTEDLNALLEALEKLGKR